MGFEQSSKTPQVAVKSPEDVGPVPLQGFDGPREISLPPLILILEPVPERLRVDVGLPVAEDRPDSRVADRQPFPNVLP
jgi:hypothetical protein